MYDFEKLHSSKLYIKIQFPRHRKHSPCPLSRPMCVFFYMLKGPAADATDAPQPLRFFVQPYDEDEQLFYQVL
jgi:hypothetical protein